MARTVFLFTGGTIDSYYDINKCGAICCDKSIIPEYLKKVFLDRVDDSEYIQICSKDSREINDFDRDEICKTIDTHSENKFLITHGTFTMFETARYLQNKLKRKDVKIVITGSMVPMQGFYHSDGQFNLGQSVGGLDNMENGIKVCIKGNFYNPDDVIELH